MSCRGGRLAALRLPAGTVWLLTGIAEAKGRQALQGREMRLTRPARTINGSGSAPMVGEDE